MEHIILDTNIFLKENFLEGKRLNELFKLSEEEKIKLVLTKITIEEIKNNYKKLTKQALDNLAIFRKPFESRVLRNNSIGKTLYCKIDKNQILKEFNDSFEELIVKSKVLIIDYSDLDIKNVFDKYFNNEFPFNSTEKKNEFPDAFALSLIEKWCIENKQECTIFSKDKDFLNFKSKHLNITKDYETYLDEKLQFYLTEKHKIATLEKLFIDNSDNIDNMVKEWYLDKLDDESLYYHFIYYEIHDIDITDVEIINKSYKIISIEEESIEIEVDVELTYSVDLVIDDEESSYYDDEDKTTYYFDTKAETVERTVNAKLILLAYIEDENTFEDTFELLDINKDKPLEVEDEKYDYR